MNVDIKALEQHTTDLGKGLDLMKRILTQAKDGKNINPFMMKESRYYLINSLSTINELCREV